MQAAQVSTALLCAGSTVSLRAALLCPRDVNADPLVSLGQTCTGQPRSSPTVTRIRKCMESLALARTTTTMLGLVMSATIAVAGGVDPPVCGSDCTAEHDTPGCDDAACSADVCEVDQFCCNFFWAGFCATLAADICGLPPSNDTCECAATISVPFADNPLTHTATEELSDPGFCCHTDEPGADGVGTVWYRFTANDSSVRIHTCFSLPPATDSLLQLFRIKNPDSGACADASECSIAAQNCPDGSECTLDPSAACADLEVLACSDDELCAGVGNNSELCVGGLTPGEGYYLLLAAKNEATRGVYDLRINNSGCKTPCPEVDVTWPVAPAFPADCVIDARQPHPCDARKDLQGAGSDEEPITVVSPVELVEPTCFTLCETDLNSARHPEYNAGLEKGEITAVSCLDSVCTVGLNRPTTPGEGTVIIYEGDAENQVRLLSLPGNVDGGTETSPPDILRLIDHLTGQDPTLPDHRCDIDRSGQCDVPDILRLIDLLNGADECQPWLNAPLPDVCGDSLLRASGPVDSDTNASSNPRSTKRGLEAQRARTRSTRRIVPAVATSPAAGTSAVGDPAGAVVALVPTVLGPYGPCEVVTLDVLLRRSAPGENVLLRQLQLDFRDSDAPLRLSAPVLHSEPPEPFPFWDFSSTRICELLPVSCGTQHFIVTSVCESDGVLGSKCDSDDDCPDGSCVLVEPSVTSTGTAPSDDVQLALLGDGSDVRVAVLDLEQA